MAGTLSPTPTLAWESSAFYRSPLPDLVTQVTPSHQELTLPFETLFACRVLVLFLRRFELIKDLGKATGHYRGFTYKFGNSLEQQVQSYVAQWRNKETCSLRV